MLYLSDQMYFLVQLGSNKLISFVPQLSHEFLECAATVSTYKVKYVQSNIARCFAVLESFCYDDYNNNFC